VISVAEIAERLNGQAGTLAPELLPNGHKAGNKWMASGIADTGHSASLYVNLTGIYTGRWRDMGNCPAGEEKGDMIDLIRLTQGLDAGGAVQDAKRRLGIHDDFTPVTQSRPDPAEMARRAEEARQRAEARHAQELLSRQKRTKDAQGLYLSGVPIEGTAAALYLRGRGIDMAPWPNSLKFHGEVYHSGLKAKIPAMLCGIYSASGEQTGCHRIYLARDSAARWGKALAPPDITDPRERRGWAKKAIGPAWGCFVPIAKGASGKSMRHLQAGEPVYVTEGVEDALVVSMIKPEARVIAAISLGNIGALVLPTAAQKMVIVADRDDKPAAQETLERVMAQQQARGITMQMVMPPAPHKDINDWWQALAGQGRMA